MKTLTRFAGCLPLVAALAGCEGGAGDGDDGVDPTAGGEEVCDSEISGTLEVDTRWACDHTLSGIVTIKGGAKLTVDPGVTIKGGNGRPTHWRL